MADILYLTKRQWCRIGGDTKMENKKCDGCDFVGFLSSPFDDKKYGRYCDACIDGMEGRIVESEEYDSYSEEW